MNVAIKTYDDPKVWLGYIDADPFTLFFPADGGDPVLHNRKAIAQDENGHSCATCNPVDLPKLLRDLREAAGISQAQMASSLGFKSPATISLYESGKRRITVGELEAMSNALGYSTEPIRFETAEDTAAEFARMNAHLPPLGADL